MTRPPELLTSPSNPLIKSLKSLERKKERAESGLFLAEGARIVGEGLARGWQAETVVIAADMADRSHTSALGTSARRSTTCRCTRAPRDDDWAARSRCPSRSRWQLGWHGCRCTPT